MKALAEVQTPKYCKESSHAEETTGRMNDQRQLCNSSVDAGQVAE